MLTLPLPLVVSLVLGFLAVRHALAGDRSALFITLLLVCAQQSLIISLTQHYGVGVLMPLQPVTAATVPVLAWLNFQSAALRAPSLRRDWHHAAGPAAIAVCVAAAPTLIDIALPLLFAGYAAAMLILMRDAAAMTRVRLAAGPLPSWVWSAIAIMLLVSAISDALIAAAMAMGFGAWRAAIVSVFSSLTLLGVGLLSLSPDAAPASEPGPEVPAAGASNALDEEELNLIARLDAHMASAKPFLDPDLTLSRLARQLRVPAKKLSAAINRQKGENVSRYVNSFRVHEASAKLRNGASVTEAMLASGFNTKSNFNREFRRVTHMPPTDYAASVSRSA